MSETWRSSTGYRRSWRTDPPTEEEKSEGKQGIQKGTIDSYCPCCKAHRSLPTAYTSIRDHGLCVECEQFDRGLSDGVITQRLPTIEEVLKEDPLFRVEVEVLREAFIALYE